MYDSEIYYCIFVLKIQFEMAIRQLSTQLAKRAQEELLEKGSEIDGHIKALRQWILNQPHLNARIGLY